MLLRSSLVPIPVTHLAREGKDAWRDPEKAPSQRRITKISCEDLEASDTELIVTVSSIGKHQFLGEGCSIFERSSYLNTVKGACRSCLDHL